MMPPSQLVKLSFCTFCTYAGGGNDLSYLNHIIIAHYNVSYGCRKCLKQAFVSSLALHNHKKVCLRLTSRKSTRGSDGKPSSGGGSDSSHRGSSKATPKKDGKAPATDFQGSSAPPASQPSPCHSGRETSHCHKSHKNSKDSGRRRRRRTQAWPGRTPATRHARMVAAISQTPTFSTSTLLMFLNSCILSIKDSITQLMCSSNPRCNKQF